MFDCVTPLSIIDDVNAITDNDGYSLVTSAQLVAWMNNELSTLWQWAVRCNRDAFVATAAGQIAGGQNYISIVAAAPTGMGVTDFLSLRAVDLNLGNNVYKKIRPWNFVTRDRLVMLSYRVLGENLWLMPPQFATQYPFRIWYVTKAPQATTGTLSTAISIPTGGDEYIKQGMAAKFRQRRDEDPSLHLQLQAAAKAGVEAWLQQAHGDQATIADVSSDYWGEMW